MLRHRVAAATARPAGSGRTRRAPRLIAGLIPEAVGSMSTEMRQAPTERRDLIEQRAAAVLDEDLAAGELWVTGLDTPPTDSTLLPKWRRAARTVAAYRDRYQITSDTALGAPPDDTNQRIDYARANAAL